MAAQAALSGKPLDKPLAHSADPSLYYSAFTHRINRGDVMSRMAEQQLYIHGGYTSATSGRTFGDH